MVMGQDLDLDVLTPVKYKIYLEHDGVDGTLFTHGKLIFDGDELAMGNVKITGLATPTANADAVTKAYLDTEIVSVLDYKGTYDANANTYYPSSPGTGDMYIISVAGSLDLPGGGNSISFDAGDWMMFNGAKWDKIDNSDLVTSVDGQTGAVSVVSDVAYNESTWNAVTAIAASKNAIRDKIDAMDTLIAANTTQAEVEAIIDAEIVGGQSIDNAIDALINTHNVADNHVGHAGVSITAGTGLTGGGTIEATRTINCDITQYTDAMVESVITAELVNGQSIDNAIDSLISNHNVANNHIDHSGVSITAGTGLTGGGTIESTRTLNCSITQYTDAMVRTIIDAEIVGGQSIDNAVDALILTHKNLVSAHHTKYTDAEVQAISINNVVEDTTPQLGGDLDLNNKYLLETYYPPDLTGSGIIMTQIVEVNTVGQGGLLHIDTGGNWKDADADAETSMPCQGMAMEAATGTKKVLLHGFFRKAAWSWTPGVPLYVSTSAGVITATKPSGTGDIVQVVGYAVRSNIVYFNPSPDYIKLV